MSSVKFGSDAYEFIADLRRQGTDDGEVRSLISFRRGGFQTFEGTNVCMSLK